MNAQTQIDPFLDEYDNKILFPEKVAKATETMRRVGLPNEKLKTQKQPKPKPLTKLQKELLSLYALDPTATQMQELKAFMQNLFEKKVVESTMSQEAS